MASGADIIKFVSAFGYDPRRVRTLTITPRAVIIDYMLLNEEGKQFLVDTDNGKIIAAEQVEFLIDWTH